MGENKIFNGVNLLFFGYGNKDIVVDVYLRWFFCN